MKYALKNANLLDGTKNMQLKANQTVLVDGGIITAVGENIDTTGYDVIDLTGKYLLPGLINLHIHLPGSGFPNKKKTDNKPLVRFIKTGGTIGARIGESLTTKYAKQQLLSGTTTVRAVGGIGRFDARIRDMIEQGKRQGARIISCNEAITVAGGHMEGIVSYGAKDEADMVRHIEQQVKEGADWIKVMITGGVLDAKKKGEPGEMKMTAEQVKVCCDTAHRLGKKVCAHAESSEGVKVAVQCGVDSVEHGAYIDDETIRILKDHKGVVVCTLSPAIPVINFDCGFEDPDVAICNGKALAKGIVQCAKACLANDIKLGLGTDAACPYTTQYDTWRELEYFHHYLGISREEALYHATLVNAEILDLDSEIGSIEPSKSADFIVTSKNPLDNFDALRNLDMVAVKGEIINNPKPDRNEECETALNDFYYNKLENDEF